MKRLAICLIAFFFYGILAAMDIPDAIATNANQVIQQHNWDQLSQLIDDHAQVTIDQWISFLSKQQDALSARDAHGDTFGSRLLFHACQSLQSIQDTAKKMVIEDRLARFYNAQIFNISQQDIVNLDIGRHDHPHKALAARLSLNSSSYFSTGVKSLLISIVVAGTVSGLGYCGYQLFNNSHEQVQEQQMDASDSAGATSDTAITAI